MRHTLSRQNAVVEIYNQDTAAGAFNKNWLYVTRPGEGGVQEFDGRPGHEDTTGGLQRWHGRLDPKEKSGQA